MYIFMEYCDEGTLEEVSRLGLQEHVIRLYSKQIAIAINVLHEHGIVHRDIKGKRARLRSRGAPVREPAGGSRAARAPAAEHRRLLPLRFRRSSSRVRAAACGPPRRPRAFRQPRAERPFPGSTARVFVRV